MSTTSIQYPPIPYGRGNFRSVRLDRCLYVDKTRFIRTLEQERFVFFIRPRRFGKTLWLTMLNAYYDRTQAKDFEAVFTGTDIGREPTGNRSRYVVLYFDFSAFKQALPTLEESFDEHCTLHVDHALRRNRDLFDEDAARAILAPPSINGKLQALFLYAIDSAWTTGVSSLRWFGCGTERFLKSGVIFGQLDALAHAVSDLDAAHALNDARNALFRTIGRTRSVAV